jgi:hypothetical protein
LEDTRGLTGFGEIVVRSSNPPWVMIEDGMKNVDKERRDNHHDQRVLTESDKVFGVLWEGRNVEQGLPVEMACNNVPPDADVDAK